MATVVQYQVSSRRYNDLFFHPRVCHVCKYISKTGMIRCDCGMLSYCSEEHMAMDREESDGNVGHGEICDIIKKLTRKGSMRKFPGGKVHEWTEQKRNYMKIMKKKLRRELTPNEQQMVLFTRCCFVCRKDAGLEVCEGCHCVDYCKNHYTHPMLYKDPEDHPCLQLRQWLFFEIKAINFYPNPRWRTFHDFPDRCYVKDMREFFKKYVAPPRQECSTWIDFISSDYLSGPLTTYDVIRKTNLMLNFGKSKSSYVIHIVDASNVDKVYSPSWEVFLHIFRKPVKLIVVMIGPDIAPDLAGTSEKFRTCREKCMSLGRELHFQYHRTSYNKYANSRLYMKPDMIIGFQLNFYVCSAWAQLISSLQSPFCPIILTARSHFHAKKLKNGIKEFLDERTEIVIKHNVFRSYRPYRDHIDGDIYYRNEYVITFQNFSLS